MVISTPYLRQFVREMPLLVVLLSLLMKLQFIKKKVDVQPYCIKALIVLKLLFFCSNFTLPIYRAFVQIVCVCVHARASHIQGISFRLCVCVCVCFPYTRAFIQIVCVCSFENIIVGRFKNIAIGYLKNIVVGNE